MAERRNEGSPREFPTREQIEKRAHEIYLKRGGEDGRVLDDWLTAEEELKQENRRR